MYVHHFERAVKSYGTWLYTETGIAFSWTNDPAAIFGVDYSQRVASFLKKTPGNAPWPEALTIVRGVDVHRSFDVNPHGFV